MSDAEEKTNQCHLNSSFGIFVQGVLAFTAFCLLIGKTCSYLLVMPSIKNLLNLLNTGLLFEKKYLSQI